MRRLITPVSFVFVFFAFSAPAYAQNILERILNNPKIQALVNRPTEITNLLGLCKNNGYQRTNQQVCQEAAQAEMAAKLPPPATVYCCTSNPLACDR